MLTCVSLMQPLTQALSLFSSLVVEKKTPVQVAAGHVTPKIWLIKSCPELPRYVVG